MIVLGVDIGTQGARVIACDINGHVKSSKSVKFKSLDVSQVEQHREQRAEDWWHAAKEALCFVINNLKDQGISADVIKSISIDGTSGTILPIDKLNNPLQNALMYNDRRADEEAQEIRKYASEFENKLGYKFNSSYALPKILWIKKNKPRIFADAKLFIHQTDYIVGKMTGEYGESDYSNALKTGYDLIELKWPDFLGNLGLEKSLLPRVNAPGQVIAQVNKQAADETGIREGTLVVAGASDGYASALSSGAAAPGDWATIIGTTMVLKGVTKELILDSKGRIYSHKHPEGYWMPGGASNVGGRCLNQFFGTKRFEDLNKHVAKLSPTGVSIYPLTGKGERFPFVNEQVQYFANKEVTDEYIHYTALMEGVSYAERLSYEMLSALGCEVKDDIYTAGGACKSDEWLKIRADILGKQLKVPKETDAAMGAALLAAMPIGFDSLEQASKSMIKIVKTVEPDVKNKAIYDQIYGEFKNELKRRGYID